MNRRAFFATLAAGLAAAADPERLLWTPGKKKIFIPKPISIPKNFRVVRSYEPHRSVRINRIDVLSIWPKIEYEVVILY
jgi:hypothetical protein